MADCSANFFLLWLPSVQDVTTPTRILEAKKEKLLNAYVDIEKGPKTVPLLGRPEAILSKNSSL